MPAGVPLSVSTPPRLGCLLAPQAAPAPQKIKLVHVFSLVTAHHTVLRHQLPGVQQQSSQALGKPQEDLGAAALPCPSPACEPWACRGLQGPGQLLQHSTALRGLAPWPDPAGYIPAAGHVWHTGLVLPACCHPDQGAAAVPSRCGLDFQHGNCPLQLRRTWRRSP